MTGQTVTVAVPFAIRKRGGRKLVITPDGVELPRRRPASTGVGKRWRAVSAGAN